MKTDTARNIRKLTDEDKRNVRETIADRLAAGEVTMGEAVRLMRLAVGMTQANYAKMVGVDIRVLIDVEKGQGNPRLDSLEKIAKSYGLAVSLVKLAPRSTGVVNV
jgi:DNA-binding XRE family transcriptional regulator